MDATFVIVSCQVKVMWNSTIRESAQKLRIFPSNLLCFTEFPVLFGRTNIQKLKISTDYLGKIPVLTSRCGRNGLE